jgi:hypothetical protein
MKQGAGSQTQNSQIVSSASVGKITAEFLVLGKNVLSFLRRYLTIVSRCS